ncbi:MAG TPA: class I SAM-dependent methyltransferase [Candidatus Omnitrophota bacterium]|nr:class I SAM-dependent methyltransferase [Candidatus Omnitrophota bacterium]
MKIDEKCNICESNEYSCMYPKTPKYSYDLIRCKNCQLVTIYPKPLQTDVVAFYNTSQRTDYKISEKDYKKANKKIESIKGRMGEAVLAAKRYERSKTTFGNKVLGSILKKFMYHWALDYRGDGKILDVGCNNGLYLYLLKNIGWEVYGVEINSEAAKAAAHIGINCFCGDLESARYPDHYFDVVRLHHVLEHVYSPYRILLEIKRILKPDGIAHIEVPNQESFSFYVFRHIWHGNQGHLHVFSPSTFKKLCAKAGFKIKKSYTQATSGKFCVDLAEWAQNKKILSRLLSPKLISNKVFKTMVIIPFCSMLNLFGYGDQYGATISLNKE